MWLPIADKFYYQQFFKINSLPDDLRYKVEEENVRHSENLVVYPGRRALHIFDLDNEKWIFNSDLRGHNYEDTYTAIVDQGRQAQQQNDHEGDSDE